MIILFVHKKWNIFAKVSDIYNEVINNINELIMALLKEDGSLDIERINNLPFEEYIKEIGTFTPVQDKEYLSKISLNENNEPFHVVEVDCTMEEDVKRNGLVDAEDFLNNMLNDVE